VRIYSVSGTNTIAKGSGALRSNTWSWTAAVLVLGAFIFSA
jgi:hypothetical protein